MAIKTNKFYSFSQAAATGLLVCAFASPASAAFIDFTGGTVNLNSGGTATTNNSIVHQNVASYEEDGFLFEFYFDGTPTSFASIIGDYYGTGNDVMHWHWADGPFGEVSEVRISKMDGATFDLGGFRVSTNTSVGGGASTGTESVSVNTSKGSSLFTVTPDSWGLGAGPDPLITIDPTNTLFQDISFFSFTNDAFSTAVGMGLDNFFINEPGDPDGSDPTTSVSEPASLAFMALGLLGLGIRRKYRLC